MAKISGNYEAVFIIDPTVGDEATAELVAKFKALVEANGTLTEVDEWGKRRLAYPINDYTEGYYVMLTFTSVPSFPAEMDRIFKITDGIMRSMIICNDDK